MARYHDGLVPGLAVVPMPIGRQTVHYALGWRDHTQRSPRRLQSRHVVVMTPAAFGSKAFHRGRTVSPHIGSVFTRPFATVEVPVSCGADVSLVMTVAPAVECVKSFQPTVEFTGGTSTAS